MLKAFSGWPVPRHCQQWPCSRGAPSIAAVLTLGWLHHTERGLLDRVCSAQPQLLETPNSNQPCSHGLGEGARSEAEKPWISFWLLGILPAAGLGRGYGVTWTVGLEMKWALEHTEFGHFSVTGSLFEQLQWMWSTLGHELLMKNCSEWAFLLYLVNDRSSKRDKNWTVQKFTKNQHTTDGVCWVLSLKILKSSQLLVLLAFIFSLITSNLVSQ